MVTPWGRYARRRVLFWRVRLPLWLAGAATGWCAAGAASAALPGQLAAAVAGVVAACLAEAAFCYRKVRAGGDRAATPAEKNAAIRALAIRGQRREMPSRLPGGWPKHRPARCLPGTGCRPAGQPRAPRAAQPGSGCGTALRSPTGTRTPGCGTTAAGTSSRRQQPDLNGLDVLRLLGDGLLLAVRRLRPRVRSGFGSLPGPAWGRVISRSCAPAPTASRRWPPLSARSTPANIARHQPTGEVTICCRALNGVRACTKSPARWGWC